jgi:tetrahydromethanopterin S-methyltransferase subunit G
MEETKSPRWSINTDQWSMIGKSLWKYTAPLVLVFLIQLQQGATIQEAIPILYGAILQLLINIVSKFVTETK